MKTYYVYILASKRNGTLYIGVTNDLIKRVYEHKNNLIEGFTNKYKVHRLVYYETTSEITSALHRENNLRNGNELGKSNSLRKTILNGKIYMKPFSHPGFLVFARNDNSMRRKPVDSWSSPGMTTRYKCVIPGEDQESRSNQVCHSWRRSGIQESPWIASPGCHSWRNQESRSSKCVIPGEDQESRSHHHENLLCLYLSK